MFSCLAFVIHYLQGEKRNIIINKSAHTVPGIPETNTVPKETKKTWDFYMVIIVYEIKENQQPLYQGIQLTNNKVLT